MYQHAVNNKECPLHEWWSLLRKGVETTSPYKKQNTVSTWWNHSLNYWCAYINKPQHKQAIRVDALWASSWWCKQCQKPYYHNMHTSSIKEWLWIVREQKLTSQLQSPVCPYYLRSVHRTQAGQRERDGSTTTAPYSCSPLSTLSQSSRRSYSSLRWRKWSLRVSVWCISARWNIK